MTENGSGWTSRGARRRLFSPANDRDRDIQDLDSLVKREEEAAAKAFESRWNFNIRDEIPKAGRYEWEKIKSDSSKSSSSVSHLPSSEKKSSSKTVESNSATPASEETSTSKNNNLLNISDADTDVGDLSSTQEKDLNENSVSGVSKRKNAETEEDGNTKVAKRCEPP